MRGKFDRVWLEFGQIWFDFGQLVATVVDICPDAVGFGPIWPFSAKCDHIGAALDQNLQSSPKVRPHPPPNSAEICK